jgi:hypothetical protein
MGRTRILSLTNRMPFGVAVINFDRSVETGIPIHAMSLGVDIEPAQLVMAKHLARLVRKLEPAR